MIVLLKIFSVAIVAIAGLKVVLGARADQLLDLTISKETITHPSVDSQIRFYGCAFAVYGILLWMCANDMTRYGSVFKVLMVVFCAGGFARIPALLRYGRPSIVIVGLGLIEVFVPPLLLWWQSTL